MDQLAQNYVATQKTLIELERAVHIYEESDQQAEDTQKLLHIFNETFTHFCNLLAEYVHKHYKENIAQPESTAGLKTVHHRGVISEHDLRKLLEALAEKDTARAIPDGQEVPLIHNIEVYHDTMQTIMASIKP